MERTIKFGPAGNPEDFYDEGGKSSLEMPAWLKGRGLNAYEYQCGRGVRISRDSAEDLGRLAREQGIALSLHAPYFINIASNDPAIVDKSLGYILQSARAAAHMGAERIVVHMGAPKEQTRAAALARSKDTVTRALAMLEEHCLGHVRMCLETMGKVNQLGTLDEVLTICAMDERILPTIDFGHLNARDEGALRTREDFEAVLTAIAKRLGEERGRFFHAHFSKIEYTKSGEKRHLTFADIQYGPEFAPLAAALAKHRCAPTIICESAGTQAKDALEMKKLYEKAHNREVLS